MEKNVSSRFMGNVIAPHELMPHLGSFFKRYPLLEGSHMADRIIRKYKGTHRPVIWDENMLFLANMIRLLFDLHATWQASIGAKEITMEHYSEGNNVA